MWNTLTTRLIKPTLVLLLATVICGCQSAGVDEGDGATARKERPAQQPYCSRSAQARGTC